jgi:hypothetical protein
MPSCKKSFWSTLISLGIVAAFKAIYEARKLKKQEARDDADRVDDKMSQAIQSLREKIQRGDKRS